MIENDKVREIVRLLEEKIDRCNWTGYGGAYTLRFGDNTIMVSQPISNSSVYLHISNNCKELYSNIKDASETSILYLPLFLKVKGKRGVEQDVVFKEIMAELDKLK